MTRRVTASKLLACGALIAVACTDAPTAPGRAVSPDRPADAGRGAQSSATVVPNTVKYSNAGAQPTTVTVNGATVSARAYTLQNGATILTVVACPFDAPASALGQLYRVQFSVYDPRGQRITVVGSGDDDQSWSGGTGTMSTLLPGAGKNFTVKLTVTATAAGSKKAVSGITLSTTVKYGPDLAVTHIEVPDRIHISEVTPVTATIRELGGDIGVTSDCVLLGNGFEVDRAPAIWVDAAGTVTCAFTTRFSDLGNKTLLVAVWNTSLADFNYANNYATIDITVLPPPVQMSYNAQAYQHTGHYVNNYTYQYDDDPVTGFGYHSTYTLNNTIDDGQQYARILASAPRGISFPVQHLKLSQQTGNTWVDKRNYTWLNATATFGTAADGGSCAQDGDAGFTYILCTYVKNSAAWTTLYYQHYAGTVTYISTQMATFTAPWGSGLLGIPGYYRNDSGWGTFTPFASNVAINVMISSGTLDLVASPVIQLASGPYSTLSTPCTTVTMPHGKASECYVIKGDYVDLNGSAAGTP